MPERMPLTIVSLRAMAAVRSNVTASGFTPRTPNSCARCLTRCMTSADLNEVLVGMHPSFTQVPPTSRISISATFAPRLAAMCAAGRPPCPPPMTAMSNFSMGESPHLWQMANGRWLTAVGSPLSAMSYLQSAICYQPFAIGYRLLRRLGEFDQFEADVPDAGLKGIVTIWTHRLERF